MINGLNATIQDSDHTVALNSHNNEVVVNGSGHTVIGLNKEGDGIDLLNYRNNSNYLGDTYLGGALFSEFNTFNLSASTNVDLFDTAFKHDSLFIVGWSGTTINSGSLTLPSTTSANDGIKRILTIKLRGGGTGGVEILPFTAGQTIQGAASLLLSTGYDSVKLLPSGSEWLIIP
jgi:hypothetical protein